MINKMKLQFLINPILLIFLFLAFVSFNANANTNTDLKKIFVQPTHIIQPNVPTFVATGLNPDQVKLAYGFKNLPFQGEGQTIAIVNAFDYPTVEADFAVFNNTFGLPPCTTANGCFQKIYANGQPPAANVDWAAETAMDIQWAHAIAPKAKIMLIEAVNNSLFSLLPAVNLAAHKGANVISMSWGTGEFSTETSLDVLFSAPTITFVASAGDLGTGVIYPSASPYVIAVGGTTLSTDSEGNYLGEVAWSGSGGGLSLYEKAFDHQNNFPLPNNPTNMRGLPDVAYHANPSTGFAVYDTYGYNGWLMVGGTSAGTPQWAAFVAVTNSGSHKKISHVYKALYTAATQHYNIRYNDIISGNNGSCGYFCTAQAGYDYTTGLGSPQAQFLAYSIIFNSLKR